MVQPLTAKQYTVEDHADPIEFCYEQGWTDGLPVIPPTVDRVEAMLDAIGLSPEHEIAHIPYREVAITAEKVAINAVMAGCKPSYFPVVLAAIEAIGDSAWNYHGPSTSTGGAAVLIVVNGPVVRQLDVNAGDNLFGPGWRANGTIGRAVRLVMRNVCGSCPGALDWATLGHPGKLSYVIGENESESPWTPLHVERGFRSDQSAVTVMAAEAPHQIYNQLSGTAVGILTTLCDDMRISGNVTGQPQYVVILAGEHVQTITKNGWTKAEVRRFIFEHTQNSIAHLRQTHRLAGDIKPEDASSMRPLVESPDDVLVVAAGGRAGAFSAYIPGWGSKRFTQAVTKEVKQ